MNAAPAQVPAKTPENHKTPLRINRAPVKRGPPKTDGPPIRQEQAFSLGNCNCLGQNTLCKVCLRREDVHAPRAGTPGFRAPEVLLKCLYQTTAIDIWSAGVIFISLLSGRYPFFRTGDDLDTLSDIITLFGAKRMKEVAKSLGKCLTIGPPNQMQPPNLKCLCEKLRHGVKEPSFDPSDAAYDLLERLLDPDPNTRMTAEEAVKHPYFNVRSLSKSDLSE